MSYDLTPNFTLTAEPVAHYRFDNLASEIDNKIDQIDDLSGFGHHLTQPVSAQQPTVSEKGSPFTTDNLTALRFTGTENLECNISTPLSSSKEYVMVTVMENHFEHFHPGTTPWENRGTQSESTTTHYALPAENVVSTCVSLSLTATDANSANGILAQTVTPRYSTYGMYQTNRLSYSALKVYDTYQHRCFPLVYWSKFSNGGNSSQQCWLDLEDRMPTDGSVAMQSDNFSRSHINANGWTDIGNYDKIFIGGRLGTYSNSINSGYKGRIYEVLIFDQDIIGNDQDILAEYLRLKYRFDGSHLVGDSCVTYSNGAWSKIDPIDGLAMSSGAVNNAKYPKDHQTVELWVRFDDLGHHKNPDITTNNGHYPIVEGKTTAYPYAGHPYYTSRTSWYLQPAYRQCSMYLSSSTAITWKPKNKQWYHIKLNRWNLNKINGQNNWHMDVCINGKWVYRRSAGNYIQVNTYGTTFGDPPEYRSHPINLSTVNVHYLDDTTKHATMSIAGYRVTNDNLSAENAYTPTGILSSSGAFALTAVDAAVTTAPRVADEDLGASVDMRIQTAGGVKPAIFGKYEITQDRWGGTYYYNNKKISTLDHLKVPGANKTFKNTHLNLDNNGIRDITGLRDLYSVTEGPGNDIPTAYKNCYLQYNALTDLNDIAGSTFATNGLFQYFNLDNNPLSSLDGIGDIKQIRYLRANYCGLLENIDDLANVSTPWPTNSQFFATHHGISKLNVPVFQSLYPANGYVYVSLNSGMFTSFDNLDSQGVHHMLLNDQKAGAIADLDKSGPQTHLKTLNISNNTFTTETLPSNVSTLWPQLHWLNTTSTNLVNISSLADIVKTNSIADQVGTSPEDVHSVYNYPLSTVAVFGDIISPLVGGYENSTVRQTGFTSAYNSGKRIHMVGELNLSNTIISDLRLFEGSFHGVDTYWAGHGRGDIHNVALNSCGITDDANTLGVIRQWAYCPSLSLKYNNITTLSNMFNGNNLPTGNKTNSSRQDYYDNYTWKTLQLQNNNISDLSWMLEPEFAGVEQVYLNYNPVDYDDVLAIETQLIALKQAGDIRLNKVHMTGTTWANGHIGGGGSIWLYSYYYRPNGSYYYQVSGGYGDTWTSTTGTSGLVTSPLYPEYHRSDGYFGFGDQPSPQFNLRKRLYDAGIDFQFPNASNGSPHQLGSGDPNSAAYQVHPYAWMDAMDWRWATTNSGTFPLVPQTPNSTPSSARGEFSATETAGTVAGASNTVEWTFQNAFDMPTGSVIEISRLQGIGTSSNSAIAIGGSAATMFGGTADWDQTAGTLTLTIQPGQSGVHDTVYTVSVTFTNPQDNVGAHNTTYGRLPLINAWDDAGIERTTNLPAVNYIMDIA